MKVIAGFNYNGRPYRIKLNAVGKQYRIDSQRWIDFDNGFHGHWNGFERCWDIGIGATGISEDWKRRVISEGTAKPA